MTTTTRDLAKYVADYARKNYAMGWDYIIENHTFKEIELALISANVTSKEAALALFEPPVEILEERRSWGVY